MPILQYPDAPLWDDMTAEARASRAEGELAELRAAQQRPGFWRRLFGG